MQGHISQVNRFGLFLKSEGRKKGFKEKEIISCISRLHSRVGDARGQGWKQRPQLRDS